MRIELSQEELLSLAPEVHELVRQATSSKRIPTDVVREGPVATMLVQEHSTLIEKENEAIDAFLMKERNTGRPTRGTVIEDETDVSEATVDSVSVRLNDFSFRLGMCGAGTVRVDFTL